MNNPLVSVVIPVYNGEQYLSTALDSVFSQNYHPFEVIVIDDGSVDNSAVVSQSYERVRYIHQTNQGVPVARNAGIGEARGEYIAFMDQDDVWLPNKLKLQMEYLVAHPKVGYVLAKQRMFLEHGVDHPSWLRTELLNEDHVAFTPSAFLTRKDVFEQIGRYDVGHQTASDVEWFFRAKDRGIVSAIISEVLLLKRVHANNQSNNVDALHREYFKIIRASIRQQSKGNLSTISS